MSSGFRIVTMLFATVALLHAAPSSAEAQNTKKRINFEVSPLAQNDEVQGLVDYGTLTFNFQTQMFEFNVQATMAAVQGVKVMGGNPPVFTGKFICTQDVPSAANRYCRCRFEKKVNGVWQAVATSQLVLTTPADVP